MKNLQPVRQPNLTVGIYFFGILIGVGRGINTKRDLDRHTRNNYVRLMSKMKKLSEGVDVEYYKSVLKGFSVFEYLWISKVEIDGGVLKMSYEIGAKTWTARRLLDHIEANNVTKIEFDLQ